MIVANLELFHWDQKGDFPLKKAYSLFELVCIALLSLLTILFNTSNLSMVSTTAVQY